MLKSKASAQLLGPALIGLLFVGLSAYVAQGRLGGREHDVFLAFYSASDAWRLPAVVITQLGSPWILLGLVGLLLVVKWRPTPALQVLWAGSVAYGMSEIVKFLVNRPRPYGLIEDFVARGVYAHGQGYPSSHVAFATAVSLTLTLYMSARWRWIAIPWILLVAWSRLYLGVHTPLDVVGGFLLGLLVYFACRYLPLWDVEKHIKR